MLSIATLQSFITTGRNTPREMGQLLLCHLNETFHTFPVVKLVSDFIDFSLPHPTKIHFLQDF